jgi:hypothetical protein
VLRPVRRHDAPQPTQPTEPGVHDHHRAAAATTGLGANTPGGGRHAATRYASTIAPGRCRHQDHAGSAGYD